MSHIAKVGNKSAKVRIGYGALYAVLLVGALSTLYPFLLMVSIALKSQVDYNEYSPRALVPGYLHREPDLYRKYVEDRFAASVDDINAAHGTDVAKAADVTLPAARADEDKLVQAWQEFKATLPPSYLKTGFGEHDNAPSLLLLRYHAALRQDFDGDLSRLNRAWTEENVSFDAVTPPFERTGLREWTPDLSRPKVAYWYKFRQTLTPNFLIPTLADPLYQAYLKQNVYEDDLAALNRAWGTNRKGWQEIVLAPTAPSDQSRKDWETFVRTKFPLRMLRVGANALGPWRAYLAAHKRAGAASAMLPTDVPASGQARLDWMDFIATSVPLAALRADSTENLWRTYAAQKYPAGASVPPAALGAYEDTVWVKQHTPELRAEFATRNFRTIGGYLAQQNGAIVNTILFCALAVLSAVLVNPLCAYALSRYPLPYTYQVLLFLLATMAFPAEVAMIPNFLLLKQLGMLNTFWALVLPGVANGFSIFLLKGFFDSLPKELYEAGILDGATEIAMFRRITIPLSLPIFSVIALNAFTASYGAFLFALVVCQDPNRWTLMVWLYNLQDKSPQYVIMAALTVAALPTLVVFLAAQKVILRGVILPSFK